MLMSLTLTLALIDSGTHFDLRPFPTRLADNTGAVALALLIALNWAWVARIARHVAAAGGWSEVVDRGRRAVVRWLEPAHLRDEV
jgi:hypothetical protein